MTKEVVSVVVSRKKMKKATNRMSKRRKLRSALKRIFNYMKSDYYMFAPLIRRSQSSSPPVSTGEVSFKPPMKKKEKKLVDGVNEYLKCDAYMYTPLASAYDGTTTPPSGVENADVSNPNPIPIPIPIPLKQSERVKHIFHQNYHSLSSTTTTTGKVLSQKKPG